MDTFVSVLWVFFMGKQALLLLFLHFDELPNVVLGDVVGGVGAAGYFVVDFAVRVFDLVSMEVVLGFEVAEDDRLVQEMRFTIAINFMQRFVEQFQLFFLHLDQGADHDLPPVFIGERGDGMVEVVAE